MKRIVLLTDFSETARNACIYALEMFRNHKVYFILLNAYDIEFSGSPYVMQVKDEMSEESEKGLLKELSFFNSKFPEARIEPASRFGPLIDVLLKEIGVLNPYLFVLGCRGESPLENFLLGSNAYEIIKNIHHPMMAIPPQATFVNAEKMVFATDLKMVNQKLATPLLDLCLEFNSELYVVNVMEDEYINRLEAEDRIASLFPGVQLSFFFVDEEDVCKGICSFTEENDAKIIILVRHNYSFFERLFHPSVTKQMVLHPQYPMLILHPSI
jgi:nucleotide-binding universal stress UspA family protein